MKGPRVGIVGAGPMGRLHARTVARRARSTSDCELVAIMDRHEGRAERVAQEFGGAAAPDLEAFASRIDAAIVCVPTHAHHRVATALLARGKDLLVEKPLAADLEEGQDLARNAIARDRILQVGHVEWYNPEWRKLADAVGPARSVVVERLNTRSDRGLDLDVVQDLMLHDLDWVTRWLAEEIVDLEAEGRCVVHDKLDEAEARLRFRSGCHVTLRASRVHPERRRRLTIEGEAGTRTSDLLAAPSSGEIVEGDANADPLEIQWGAFLESVRSRKSPESDASVGVDALRLVDRVRQSIRRGDGSSQREHDPDFGG